MTTEGSLGSLLIHTLLSPRYGYDLERIDRMSSPLSLDFNPRSLVVDSSISYSLSSDKPSPSLDAIFVPFRSRPEYVSELLKILPENETPIFLLPTSSLDLNSVRKLPRQGDSSKLEFLAFWFMHSAGVRPRCLS